MNQQLWEFIIGGFIVLAALGILAWSNVINRTRHDQALIDAAKKPIELHQQLLSREDNGTKALAIVADLVKDVGEQLAHMREVGVPVITRPVNGRTEVAVHEAPARRT